MSNAKQRLAELFQSTLPRGERLDATVPVSITYKISIHAPARGATEDGRRGEGEKAGFQSTLPRGERPCSGPEYRNSDKISIHAPARGATQL